jgi:hypothetical protein
MHVQPYRKHVEQARRPMLDFSLTRVDSLKRKNGCRSEEPMRKVQGKAGDSEEPRRATGVHRSTDPEE